MTLYSRFLACVFICLANTAYSAAPIQDLAVDFGTEKFLIPKVYLPSGGHFDKSKNYAALNIFVFLPDFRGGGSDIDARVKLGGTIK